MGAFPHNFSDFTYGQVALSFTVAPLDPGGAPICEGAGTHTSI